MGGGDGGGGSVLFVRTTSDMGDNINKGAKKGFSDQNLSLIFQIRGRYSATINDLVVFYSKIVFIWFMVLIAGVHYCTARQETRSAATTSDITRLACASMTPITGNISNNTMTLIIIQTP